MLTKTMQEMMTNLYGKNKFMKEDIKKFYTNDKSMQKAVMYLKSSGIIKQRNNPNGITYEFTLKGLTLTDLLCTLSDVDKKVRRKSFFRLR